MCSSCMLLIQNAVDWIWKFMCALCGYLNHLLETTYENKVKMKRKQQDYATLVECVYNILSLTRDVCSK